MQILIDIPKMAYDLLKSDATIDWLDAETILDRIVEGVVLPNGHGRLIDVNEFVLLYDSYRKGNALKGDDDAFLNAIRCTQTVIEADKESGE